MLFKREFKKKLLYCYSSNLLISSYSHIGFKKNLTSHAFRKALLCFYSNVAIINPALTLANLKFSLNFLCKLLLKNIKTCFILFNFSDNFKKYFLFKDQFYFFNNWISGFLTNYSSARPFGILRRNRFCSHMPGSLVVFGAEPQKSIDIASEANKLMIPAFIFVDSLSNPSNHSYWIPINLKSGYTKVFFINLVNSFLEKIFYLRKCFFVKRCLDFFKNDPKFKRNHSLDSVTREKIKDLFFRDFRKLRRKAGKAWTIEDIRNFHIELKILEKRYPYLIWRVREQIYKVKRFLKRRFLKLKKCA